LKYCLVQVERAVFATACCGKYVRARGTSFSPHMRPEFEFKFADLMQAAELIYVLHNASLLHNKTCRILRNLP
jgi:hypothetical protein